MNHRSHQRRGFTLTELVVAASLLVGVMAILAPLTVRSGRLWQDTRHQLLALDELTNQLEYLISLDPDARRAAVDGLALSPWLTTVLPRATIDGEIIQDEHGTRMVLSLDWNRAPGSSRRPRRVTLVGWIDPLPSDTRVGRASE